ncbi:MAG: glycosyltransferase family 1 protein [Acidimicrobiales bacterium]
MRNLIETEGVRGLAVRTLNGLARRVDTPAVLTSVRDADVLGADITRPFDAPYERVTPGDPITINWVMPPPGPNSGGHTTAFRLIRYLQERGHTSTVYFYDVYGSDADYYREIVQTSYADVAVANVFDGMDDAHAVFATCWESAYPVFNARSAGKRFYLVQDFEPWFYPSGASWALAENTYRMGFHAITAGAWLSGLLSKQYGMAADHFDFGCDASVYDLQDERRDGIVFYARPRAPRRAFELGVLALELFAQDHPDVEIHTYGDHVGRIGSSQLTVTDHGLVTPGRLNAIYNRSFAGLSLSMSNVSLVPHEMLASGCIPVVNDAAHNRIVLDNEHVRYAPPDPHSLARALGDLVTDPNHRQLAERAAASVTGASWDDAGAAVESALHRALA